MLCCSQYQTFFVSDCWHFDIGVHNLHNLSLTRCPGYKIIPVGEICKMVTFFNCKPFLPRFYSQLPPISSISPPKCSKFIGHSKIKHVWKRLQCLRQLTLCTLCQHAFKYCRNDHIIEHEQEQAWETERELSIILYLFTVMWTKLASWLAFNLYFTELWKEWKNRWRGARKRLGIDMPVSKLLWQ